MKPIEVLSPAPLRNAMLTLLLIMPHLWAAEALVHAHPTPETSAFARYIAAVERRDTFAKSGPALISIEASLPGLYKEASLRALRAPDENGHNNYAILGVDGDGTVVEEVIARYLMVQGEMEKRPGPSVAVTPANYKFHFAAEVRTGESSAYIYRIHPKKSRPGLFSGEVWIDSETGTEITLSGHVKKMFFTGIPTDVVRETKLQDGSAYARVTHLAFTLPQLGRAELVVTEYLLQLAEPVPGVQSY